jgi:adenine-specific DNA-methyltransferase
MAKQYKGSLSLDWYNKQKAILLRSEAETKKPTDIPAPKINWVNKDKALFYEIIDEEGRGIAPYWVDGTDIRVKEARPLIFQKAFKAVPMDKEGALPSMVTEFKIEEVNHDDDAIDNILIKGDNLLALNAIQKIFSNKPENEKIKCVCIDPPFNTSYAFVNYDDNLEHSEWLTMMRDRLRIIYDLLRDDGVIYIILDDREASYCKLLLDEIFGRQNYCNEIIVKTSSSYGFKSTSKDLLRQANHILFYAKNKEVFDLKKVYIEKDYDVAYKYIFIETEGKKEEDWQWKLVRDYFSEIKGYHHYKMFINEVGENDFNNQLFSFVLENANNVFRTAAVSGGAYLKRKNTIEKSKGIKNKIIRHPNDDMDYLFIGGERVIFYSERLTEIDGLMLPAEIITDIWTDIPIEGLSGEGGVDFPKGKKPEKLISRLLEMSTYENDIVLDIFGGSGTSFAVSHKLNRKWIGVEIGKQADTHIVKRLKDVLLGIDQTGISKEANWQGGGSFKYYHLGDSIIRLNEDGTGDFNWTLGKEFIQESFLSSYDYIIDTSIDFQEDKLFTVKKDQPLVGVQTLGTKKRVAVITLNEPKGKLETLSYEEMQSIYKTVKKKFSPEYINIFTNRGVEIAYDSKPDDLEVVKIPNAIFAELEK